MTRLQAAGAVAKVAELAEVKTQAITARLAVPAEDIYDRPCIISTQSDADHTYDRKTNRLYVEIPASVVLSDAPEGKDTDAPAVGAELMRIEVTLRLVYELTVEAPPAEERDLFFNAFASLNGTYNAWPYLRELVQDLAARLGVPGLVLPVFRVPRSDEEAEAERPAPKLRVVSGAG